MSEKYDLTQGSVWKSLFRFFLPVAAGGIVQQLYNTVDGLIVGKYCGTAAFAAISGSVTQVLNLMVGTFIALTGGAAVYIAQLYGVGDKEKIKRAVTTSIYTCGVLGVIVSAVGFTFARDLLELLDTPAETMDDATTYLKLCFLAAFAVMLYNMGASIIRASGDSTRPFIFLCICCFTNIVLDYITVKVLQMGVLGAAAATAFSQLVSMILVLSRMLTTKSDYRLHLKLSLFSGAAIRSTLKFGVPSAAQQILYGVTNTLIQVALNSLGTVAVAAWSLTGKVDGIYWAIINAAGISMMNFIGQNYGAGKIGRVKEAAKVGMRNFLIFTVSICVLLALVGKKIFPFFLPDDAYVVDLAYNVMLFFVIPYFLWTIIEILSGVLKGCGDVVVPAILLLVGVVGVRLIFVWTIFNVYHSIYTLAAAYAASWLVTAFLLVLRYKGGKWKKRREIL